MKTDEQRMLDGVDASLIGATFDAQVVPFEAAPSPRVSTSNALALSVGHV
ncbi:MAG: hypothetical protein H6835_17490 [Planctomycetes bacterium]|nr:hypothetical protein [Planctomycetota bacterium]